MLPIHDDVAGAPPETEVTLSGKWIARYEPTIRALSLAHLTVQKEAHCPAESLIEYTGRSLWKSVRIIVPACSVREGRTPILAGRARICSTIPMRTAAAKYSRTTRCPRDTERSEFISQVRTFRHLLTIKTSRPRSEPIPRRRQIADAYT